MGIRVEVADYKTVSAALARVRRLAWLYDSDPSGIRLKWYKKRHDHYLKPNERRNRRQATVNRRKRHEGYKFPSADGLQGRYYEGDLHWV